MLNRHQPQSTPPRNGNRWVVAFFLLIGAGCSTVKSPGEGTGALPLGKPLAFRQLVNPSSALLKCIESPGTGVVNRFAERSECAMNGGWNWSISTDAERDTEPDISCIGEGGRALPLSSLAQGAAMLSFQGQPSAWNADLRLNFSNYAHPCGAKVHNRMQLIRSVRDGGGLLPPASTLTTQVAFNYTSLLQGSSVDRVFVSFRGFWDGSSHLIELNLHGPTWDDLEPNSAELLRNKSGAGAASYLIVDGTKLGDTVGQLALSTDQGAEINWHSLLDRLAQSGALARPAAGWENASTQSVGVGIELRNGSETQAGIAALKLFDVSIGGVVTLSPCGGAGAEAERNACVTAQSAQRCNVNPASPSGFAWSEDTSCVVAAPDAGAPMGGGAGGGGGSGAGGGNPMSPPTGGGSGTPGGAGGGNMQPLPPVSPCAVQNTAERYSCSPNPPRRCNPETRSSSGFSWVADPACTFTQCSAADGAKQACNPASMGQRCLTEPLSSTGFAWKQDAACSFTACGATVPAQKGQCAPTQNSTRCAPNGLSPTGYAWKPDSSCLWVQCGGTNGGQKGQCSSSKAMERCASEPTSPTGYAWKFDANCTIQPPPPTVEQCGAQTPLQRGDCSPDRVRVRCSANAASPTGYAWTSDASCTFDQCGGANPAQRGQCYLARSHRRCAPESSSATGYAIKFDATCP